MSYQFLEDRAQVFFNGQHYIIRMTKKVAPNDNKPVDFVYARLDMSIIPENSFVTSEYYRQNPISLENLNFRANLNRVYPLRYNVLSQYPSNIELAILMHMVGSASPSPIGIGEIAEVSHQIQATMFQWGNWLQREIRVPTQRVSVSIYFPKGIATCSGISIIGGKEQPLLKPLEAKVGKFFESWHWETESPQIHERFRFMWQFKDEREKRIKENIEKHFSHNPSHFLLSKDGSEAVWYGERLRFSTKQAMTIQYLWHENQPDFSVSEQELLEHIGSQSSRIRDIFKTRPPLLQTLLKWHRGRVKLDISEISYNDFMQKKNSDSS